MSSTNKTTKLNLNQWIGSDIPKRADFNSDNSIIDNILGTHTADKDIHMTAAERTLWNTQCVTGMYFGSGAAQVTVTLGFQPKALFIFPYNKSLGNIGTAGSYSAIGTKNMSSLGLEVTATGFKVSHGTPYAVDGIAPKLNELDIDYGYIAIK
ncbi:MAG: hypothetical protein RR911_05810 [Oscillospiraceae bacterium]